MDPASQELQLRRAGVPLANIHRDVGVSGTTGTQGCQGWHQLDSRLAGGDTLVVVAIDRIGPPLVGHHPEHLRAAGPWGEDPLPSGVGGPVGPLPGGRRGESRGLLRPNPDHVRRLGGRPRAGVHQATHQGGVGEGQAAGEGAGITQEDRSPPGGEHATDAGGRCWPTADRPGLRVLGQHRPEGASAGRSINITIRAENCYRVREGMPSGTDLLDAC